MTKPLVRGPGRFQWVLGGWFGAQLGSTLWMLLGGVVLLARPSVLGLVPLVCFAVANAVGCGLWRMRNRLAPYPALQALLLVVGVCALVAVAALTRDIEEPGRYYRTLLLIPGLMVYFHVLERSARGRSSTSEADG